MYMVVPSPPHSFKTVARISIFSKAIVWRVLSLQIKPREMDYAADVVWKVSMNVRYLITFFLPWLLRLELNVTALNPQRRKLLTQKIHFQLRTTLREHWVFSPLTVCFRASNQGICSPQSSWMVLCLYGRQNVRNVLNSNPVLIFVCPHRIEAHSWRSWGLLS